MSQQESPALKVLHVVIGFPPATHWGGTGTVVQAVHRALVDEGIQSRVLTSNLSDRTNRLDPEGVEPGVTLVPMLFFDRWPGTVGPAFPSPLAVAPLVRLVRDSDVVHVHGWRNLLSLTAAIVSIAFGKRLVVQPHGGRAYDGGRLRIKRIFDRVIGDRLMVRSDIRLALSDREYLDLEAVQPGGIVSVSNPAPFGIADASPNANARRVLFVGRLTRTKGVDLLLDGFAEVYQRDSSMRLDIVGPDDGELTRLELQAGNLGLEHAVSFLGRLDRDEIREQLEDRPIVVVPSRSDVFGVVILEAAAFGCPIAVSTRVELIDEIRDCVVPFDPEPHDIARAICDASRDADALGERSRRLVSRYDPTVLARQLVAVAYEDKSAS